MMKIEAGARFRHRRTGGEYEVVAQGELKMDDSSGWKPCVIYRPVTSGFALAEAEAEGRSTWCVRPVEEFTEARFEPIN